MPHTEKTCYERTRLHFIVYVCDHHCSLSHGRPPLTRDTKKLKSPRALLDSEFSSPLDLTLISQVELWSISTQVFDNFGAATDCAFVYSRLAELDEFSELISSWHHKWTNTMGSKFRYESGGLTVLKLYSDSARLYLLSHLFRGSSPDLSNAQTPLKAIDRVIDTASRSALDILKGMSEISETTALPVLPSYFYTMLAFASVFLLNGPRQTLDGRFEERVLHTIHRLIESCSGPPVIEHKDHPISRIVNGLRTALGSVHTEKSDCTVGKTDDSTCGQLGTSVTNDGMSFASDPEADLSSLMFSADDGFGMADFDDFVFSNLAWQRRE